MKYTHRITWEAVYTVLPSIKTAMDKGVDFNLPRVLEMAAKECFMLEMARDLEYLTSTNMGGAKLVIYDALKDLNTIGWMEFGDRDNFW